MIDHSTAPATPGHALEISARQFLALRDDVAFQRILTLARIVNSIRFVQVAYPDKILRTPSALRQRVSGAFYLSALLVEAFRFAERLGEHFTTFAAFQTKLVPLLADENLKELRFGILTKMRSQAVFHHDDHVMMEGMHRMKDAPVAFATARGSTNGDIYYDLSDLAVMHFALDLGPAEDFTARTEVVLGDIATAATKLAAAAEAIVGEYLRERRITTPVELPDQ